MANLSQVQLEKLYQAACTAYKRAYAPYSNFQVGAAVLAANGQIYQGCNLENAAYPEGLCAEAGALAAMALAGQRQVLAIMIVGAGESLVTPCGGCRQKLREFASPDDLGDLEVLVGSLAETMEIRARFSLAELLPQSFGPDHLKFQKQGPES